MTAPCEGGHPKDKHGNPLYCDWCPEILDRLNKRNKLREKLALAVEAMEAAKDFATDDSAVYNILWGALREIQEGGY